MIPLAKGQKLEGKRVRVVLDSGRLVGGPAVAEFRGAISDRYGYPPARVVLGASATDCFRGIAATARQSWADQGYSWPMLDDVFFLYAPRTQMPRLWTDIGGGPDPQFEVGEEDLVDASHSWALPVRSGLVPRFVVFSCGPIKYVGAPRGGVVLCKHGADAERLQTWLESGFDRSPRYWEDRKGSDSRAHMTEVDAALALEAFERLDKTREEYAEAWERVTSQLEARGFRVRRPGKHRYLVQVELAKPPSRLLREMLRREGVQNGCHFPPAGLLSLPCWPGLSAEEVVEVADKLVKVVREVRR